MSDISNPRKTELGVRSGSGSGDRAALAEQVHARLRSDIVHARLHPGEAVSENSLAALLGVSRTPVREAVQRLVREGLVHVLPQRGSYVALLSMQRIKEAIFVREAVETQVVRRIVEAPPDPQGLQALEDCIEHQAATLRAQDLEGTMQADDAFHHKLLDLCGMSGIWSVIGQARDMHRRVRAIAVPELQSGDQALADHRAIVHALRLRDAAMAEQCVAAHLRRNALLMRRIANLHPDYFEVDERDNPVL
jgi:GntR family transcriptional regulator, rspAB operon transcriptional repressor